MLALEIFLHIKYRTIIDANNATTAMIIPAIAAGAREIWLLEVGSSVTDERDCVEIAGISTIVVSEITTDPEVVIVTSDVRE